MKEFKDFMQASLAAAVLIGSSVFVYFYFAVLHVPGFGPTSSLFGGIVVVWLFCGTYTACINKIFEYLDKEQTSLRN